MKVLIIGGGIGGLAAAVALRQAGIEAPVFERAPELREVGAGLTLWTNAIKVLRQLGLGPAVEALSTPLTTSEVRDWRGRAVLANNLSEMNDRLGAPTVGIHRADLQRALADALPGDALHLGRHCVGYAADGDRVRALFEDGSEETGDALVGADGLRSRVRAQLLGDEMPRYAGYVAWRGVGQIEHPAVPPRLTLLAVGRGSQVGMLPIGKGRTYWFATVNGPEGGSDAPGGHKATLLARFGNWYEPVPAVIGATDERAILRNDICDRAPVRKWGEGRVTLLGDAAHPTTPNLGQGACMAIEDSLVLARCLKRAADAPAALRAYEGQRYARTAYVTNQSWQFGKLLAWERDWACGLRNWLMKRTRGMTTRQIERLVGADV